MLTRTFEIVLFLNLTGLFSFLAVQIGVPIAAMSAVIMAFLFVYLFVNYRYVVCLLKNRTVFFWCLFVFLWPAATLFYSEVNDVRANAVNLYLVMLLLSSAIWFSKVGFDKASSVFVVAGIVTVAGLILSLISSAYFEAVATAANARFEYHGRAFGFFLQPNVAAENLCFMFVLLLPFMATRGVSSTIAVSAVFAFAVLITGSRGGMIIAFAMLVYAHVLTNDTFTRSMGQNLGKRIAITSGLLVTIVATTQIVGVVSGDSNAQGFSLADRVSAFTSLDFAGGGMMETALSRFGAFAEHWPGIVENPVLGQGVATSQNFAASGRFLFASHNQYLQVAFDLGLPALVFFCYLIFRLWRLSKNPVSKVLNRGINPTMLLVIAMVPAGMFSNSILNSRVFFIVLGALLACHCLPVQVFKDRIVPIKPLQTSAV